MSNISDFGSKKILARNLVQIPAPLWNQNAPKPLLTRDSRGVRGSSAFFAFVLPALSAIPIFFAEIEFKIVDFCGGSTVQCGHFNWAFFHHQNLSFCDDSRGVRGFHHFKSLSGLEYYKLEKKYEAAESLHILPWFVGFWCRFWPQDRSSGAGVRWEVVVADLNKQGKPATKSDNHRATVSRRVIFGGFVFSHFSSRHPRRLTAQAQETVQKL